MNHMETAAADDIAAAIRANPASPKPQEKAPMATKSQIIQKMANALIDRVAVTGGATEQAMLDAGFTRAQVEQYGEAAADKARSIQTT